MLLRAYARIAMGRRPRLTHTTLATALSLVLSVLVSATLAIGAALGPAAAESRSAAQIARQGGLPTTIAQQAVIMDAASGAILFQHNADELTAPDGLSKLMTLAVAFKAIKSGKIKLTDEIKMSVNAWRHGGAPSGWTAMFVPVNTSEPMETLLQGIVVQSGNDATMAVAEALAGSEAKFAERMTQEARRIGLDRSKFTNATGLPDETQQTTARELALLALHLMREYPEFYPRFAQKELNYRKFRFINDNPLLGTLGVDGLKTGYVKKEGFGLIASGNKDGRRLILVMMGLPKKSDVRTEGHRLLEWGFASIAEYKLFDKDEVVAKARVWGGDRMWLPLVGDGPVTVVLPKYPPNPKLKAELVYKRPLKTPIRKGDKVATLRVTSPSQSVSEVPLYAAEDVQPGGIVRRGLDTIVDLTLGWAL
ncbi:MAG: D-alanyl-D-alanine carboxypeptidase family protein [Hyphomicrobiaceae bacterium]